MSIKRFVFQAILLAIFCCTAIIGPIIIDAVFIGMLAIVEIMAFIMLFVPFAGTFLFRITGLNGMADGSYLDVYLADGWLHKIITFVIMNAIISGIAGLIFAIPESTRIVLGLCLILFIMTVALKIDNAKGDYDEREELITDFLPTLLGLGVACYVVFFYTSMPTVIGIIILCLTAVATVVRNVFAMTRW